MRARGLRDANFRSARWELSLLFRNGVVAAASPRVASTKPMSKEFNPPGTAMVEVWVKVSSAVAAGMVSKSAQFAATDNLARLPGYARVDASVFYRAARYDVQVNLQNVGNHRFYDAAQSDYQIYPAAPINGTATVRYRF